MSTYFLLFWAFFKISLFSIGGGYNMVPLMQHEVESRGWLPPGRFVDMLAISEATPGPIAVNLATFAGYQVAGVSGAVVATTAVSLPGLLLLFTLGIAAKKLRRKPAFQSAMQGLYIVLAGLLTTTAIRLAQAMIPEGAYVPPPSTLLIFAVALTLLLWKKAHPLPLLAGAAVVGLTLSWLAG